MIFIFSVFVHNVLVILGKISTASTNKSDIIFSVIESIDNDRFVKNKTVCTEQTNLCTGRNVLRLNGHLFESLL